MPSLERSNPDRKLFPWCHNIIGPFWLESPQWIPFTKSQKYGALMLSLSYVWTSFWSKSRVVGYLKPYGAHCNRMPTVFVILLTVCCRVAQSMPDAKKLHYFKHLSRIYENLQDLTVKWCCLVNRSVGYIKHISFGLLSICTLKMTSHERWCVLNDGHLECLFYSLFRVNSKDIIKVFTCHDLIMYISIVHVWTGHERPCDLGRGDCTNPSCSLIQLFLYIYIKNSSPISKNRISTPN